MSPVSITSKCISDWACDVALIPIRSVEVLCLWAIQSVAEKLGYQDTAKSLEGRVHLLSQQLAALITGLSNYGSNFLTLSANAPVDGIDAEEKEFCKGSCYLMIREHLENPTVPLVDIAKKFSQGAPLRAVQMHAQNAAEAGLIEEPVLPLISLDLFPSLDTLENGVYSLRVLWCQNSDCWPAHRIVFFKQEEDTYIFDPSIGLSREIGSDLQLPLRLAAKSVKRSADRMLAECFRHRLDRNESAE